MPVAAPVLHGCAGRVVVHKQFLRFCQLFPYKEKSVAIFSFREKHLVIRVIGLPRDGSCSGTWERVLSRLHAVVSIQSQPLQTAETVEALLKGVCLHRPAGSKAIRGTEGRGRAYRLCRHVFTIALLPFVTESQFPRASENLELDGLKVVGLECDVSSEESVADAFARTLGAFGRVDAVVASAGE